MKLFDRFYALLTEFNPMASISSRKTYSKKQIEIAENFSIGFSEWKSDYDYDGFLSTKELLEIYKKTL